MLDWLFKKIRPTSQKSTLHTSNDELTKIFRDEQVCPDCGVWEFLEGPSGGMSINIMCDNCGSIFNDAGPFGIERIRNFDIIIEAGNYREFTRDIINNWNRVLTDSISEETTKWCEDNISDTWSIKWGGNTNKMITYYFETIESAVAFKLRWL